MRIRLLAALAAVFMLGSAASAQPDKAQPTVELRLRSVNDLLTKAEYVGDLVGQGEVVKQVAQIAKQLSADGKGIEGVDPKRPFGAQATLTADVINSSFTVMVPIADQDRFLGLLKDRLQLNPEKADDGSYKVAVPIINDIHLRFANEYVYVGRTAKDVDPKTIPTPKAFFAKDDGSIGSITVHIDQIPAELKTFVLGQFELAITEQRKAKADNASAAEKAALDWFADNATSGLKALLEDAKTFEARVFIDETKDDLSAEVSLTAKSGTTLAKNIASLAGKTSVPAAIVGGKDAAVRVTAKGGLPDSTKKDLGKVVDSAIEEILKQVGEQEKPIAEKVLKTIAPTLKAGELDAAVSFTPNEKGHYTLIAAVGVKKGKDIEGLAKDLIKEFGGMLGGAVDFDLDVEKVGDFSLHKVTVNVLPPEAEKVFGTNKLWVAISEDYVAFSVEPEGAALRAGVKAKAAPVPALSVEVAAAKLVPLLSQKLAADEIKAIVRDAFGDGSPAGKDTLSVTLTGGDKLTLKGTLKGKAVRFIAGFFMLAKR
jgi:hypothetical protein